MKKIAQTVLDQPFVVFPKKCPIITHMIASTLAREIKKPSAVMMRIGRMLRLVIPSMASASIFRKG